MRRYFVMLLMSIFTASIITGCGQNQGDKKPPVINPEAAVTEDMVEEEDIDTEESPKTVTESAIDKAAAISEAQGNYKAPTEASEASKFTEELVAANFDSGEKPNNLGGNFGAWNKDPSDPTQWCKEGFDNVTKRGDIGFAMKLDYSVDSPNPAYNGFWMMFPNLDASKYDAINFWVKGDPQTGYTTVFKIELKNSYKQTGRYYVSNVSDQWQEISIPLTEFKGLIDKTSLTEFVIVFEDRMASNKKGVLYIDDIRFVKK
ncbi:MAG: carbohydrate binding domain-containing protein [Candidatus Omnitrophota bacterium]|nr:carbohydrate binding domain-containing protein [Candidatus Omnitrophota bacterium]